MTSNNDKVEKVLDKIYIPVEGIFDKFDEHLKSNKRILFSGKFGTGKTFFLNEFFKAKQDNYDVYHLYPVNYQISSSQDIIELMKYDILISLLNKNDKLFKENDENKLKILVEYMKQAGSVNSFLDSALSILNIFEVGKTLGKPLQSMLKFDKQFQEFANKYKKGEKGIVEEYIKEVGQKNISETDYFSQILKDKIKLQKGKKQKSVLILDDLDRIDPEHIFRIFNIFSAHHDEENNEVENKFGFDKIILVCDYNNIRSIFHHKYGADADFNAYIDKFYCSHPYEFNNVDVVSSAITEIISRYKTEDEYIVKHGLLTQPSTYLHMIFLLIVEDALTLPQQYQITLRQILKPVDFQNDAIRSGVYDEIHTRINPTREHGIVQSFRIVAKVLKGILGSNEDVLLLFDRVINNDNSTEFRLSEMNGYLLRMIKGIELNIDKVISNIDIGQYKYKIEISDGKIKNIKAKNADGLLLSDKQVWYALMQYCIKDDWSILKGKY